MCKLNQVLLVVVLLGIFPGAARAQWAVSRTEHDWRLVIGGNSYGLTQEFFSTFSTVIGTRTTTLHFGHHKFNTRLPAALLATLVGLSLGAWAFFLFPRDYPCCSRASSQQFGSSRRAKAK